MVRETLLVEFNLFENGCSLGLMVAFSFSLSLAAAWLHFRVYHLFGVDDAHIPPRSNTIGGIKTKQQSHDCGRGGQCRPAGDDARVMIRNADYREGVEFDGAGGS
mmetsp:Transcript_20751/g.37477  ORF Transcript_20751/g.37477 Transcript_20751/m.37477 type:complete len:105 (+) Transcript_20751:1087-1401(+)